ncbi:MAG: DUF5320 domain-containing protein [Pseudomonadota bacterium]|nr:DUF5320 domain-containing protein [Pseudomonadota bacterium]
MPRGDRTGPRGLGAMTGRAAGFCAGFGVPGYANPVAGRGFGMGFGRGLGAWGRGGGFGGRGWRNAFYATGQPGWMRFGGYIPPYGYAAPYSNPDPELERQSLKGQADALQAELDLIRKRLEEMDTDAAKS